MESAFYGRRRLGRCIKAKVSGQDPQSIGCFSDVMALADARCSGKFQCEIRIPDPELDSQNSCNDELRVYLEASYKCASGMTLLIKFETKVASKPRNYLKRYRFTELILEIISSWMPSLLFSSLLL